MSRNPDDRPSSKELLTELWLIDVNGDRTSQPVTTTVPQTSPLVDKLSSEAESLLLKDMVTLRPTSVQLTNNLSKAQNSSNAETVVANPIPADPPSQKPKSPKPSARIPETAAQKTSEPPPPQPSLSAFEQRVVEDTVIRLPLDAERCQQISSVAPRCASGPPSKPQQVAPRSSTACSDWHDSGRRPCATKASSKTLRVPMSLPINMQSCLWTKFAQQSSSARQRIVSMHAQLGRHQIWTPSTTSTRSHRWNTITIIQSTT